MHIFKKSIEIQNLILSNIIYFSEKKNIYYYIYNVKR